MTEYQKCPVCEGKGEVAPGFYLRRYPGVIGGAGMTCHNGSPDPEPCRTCRGRGIVARPPEEKEKP